MSRILRITLREGGAQGPPEDEPSQKLPPSQGFLLASANPAAAAPVVDQERRAEPRYACDYPARIASSDRAISTAGRIVNISANGAKVEVMYPRRGPSAIFLFDRANSEIYECEVRWRSDDFIGVRFLDVLGPGRRRRFMAGDPVPIKKSAHEIIQLGEPPEEDVRPGPPPRRLGGRLAPAESRAPSPPSRKPKA